MSLVEVDETDGLPEIAQSDVVVDGIFGSGLSRKVSGFPGNVIRHINAKAEYVVAIDIPSGLFGEDNSENEYDQVIQADYTLSFQFPFLSFFFRLQSSLCGALEGA